MKITKARVRQIIKEELEFLTEYRIPRGFMRVKDIPIPGRDRDLEWLMGNPRLKPMTYNQNNGVLIAIPKSGPMDAAVWMPDEKGGAPDDRRSVPYAGAVQALKDDGYTYDSGIYVPFSN